jgi:carbonic anhydrase
MTLIDEILKHNAHFVARKEYERYQTDRFPNKRVAIIACMDTRLVELLPRAMNLGQGDAKVIKAAGAIVSHPFGSVMRSLIVAVYELGAAEVAVVGHYGCGMTGLDCERVLEKARQRGVTPEVLATLQNAGIDLSGWLSGFATPQDGVRSSVDLIRKHPILPRDVPVHGLMIDPETGKLDLLIDGYDHSAAGRLG